MGFVDVDEERAWAAGFVRGYDFDHRHIGIRCISSAQRRSGRN